MKMIKVEEHDPYEMDKTDFCVDIGAGDDCIIDGIPHQFWDCHVSITWKSS